MKIYLRYMGLVSLCAIFLYNLFFILNYYYPIYYADEWVSLDFYTRHGLMESVLCLHNGHPLILPNIIYRLNLLLFDGAPSVRVWFVLSIAIVNAFLIASMFIRALKCDGDVLSRITVYLVCLCMGTWLVNYHKLLWGMAVHDHLAILGAVVAAVGIAHLDSERRALRFRGVGYVILGGLLSSLSFGFGVAVWGGVLVSFLILYGFKNIYLTIPLLGVVVSWLILKFTPSCYTGEISNLTAISFMPNKVFTIVPTLLGSPFVMGLTSGKGSTAETGAMIVGGVGLLALTLVTYRLLADKCKNIYVVALISIAWFCVGCAFLVSIGRNAHANIALAPRYLPISLLYWWMMFGIGWVFFLNLMHNSSYFKWFKFSLIILASLIFLFFTYVATKKLVFTYNYHLKNSLMYMVAENDDQRHYVARLLQGNKPYTVLDNMGFVEKNRLDVFNDGWLVEELKQNPVEVNNKCLGFVSSPKKIGPFWRLSGWARSSSGQEVERIYVVLDGHVVGLGRRAPIFGRAYFNAQKVLASDAEQLFSSMLPYELSVAVGLHSHWIAFMNVGEAEINNKMQIYAHTGGGELCELNFP